MSAGKQYGGNRSHQRQILNQYAAAKRKQDIKTMKKQTLFAKAQASKQHRFVALGDYTTISYKSVRVVFYSNGHIVRGDVRLDLCKKMTVTEAAKCLSLV